MNPKSVFNATVCLLGILILLIHTVNLIFKKEKRNDEKVLLSFFIFTIIHFATYLTFVLIKEIYTSNTYIMGFYTTFYIMNNIEVFLFFLYMINYNQIKKSIKTKITLINLILFVVFVASDIVNIFTRMYFTSVDGVYHRAKFMILCQGYQFVMLGISFIFVLLNRQLNIREKTAFSLYCLLPLVAIIIQNMMPGYAIAYAALLISIEILFFFANVEKNIRIREDEKQLKEADIKIMMSQIQPHFVYNTLSSISTLININPRKAQKALDNFTDYLRMNFSTLTEAKLVSFEDELKHIKTYVDLEKVRFNERLTIRYDIQVLNFSVPPLSIQPIVENAVKHGIMKKIEGGVLILKTYETNDAFVVEVIDNGVGFDINKLNYDDNNHIGLKNVKHRITTMTKGSINIESAPKKGTKVVVKFFK